MGEALMDSISSRATLKRTACLERLRNIYPALLGVRARPDASAVALGQTPAGLPVLLPLRARMEHSHIIGTTGGGKSKFLEHCIRQDIAAGRGVLVIDPHGEHPDSLYRSILGWLDEKGYLNKRTVHVIDPNAATHTIGFNPLARPDPDTDLSVIAGVTLEAFQSAWGDEDTTMKPTIERLLNVTFTALADLDLTLVEAPLLLDRADRHGLRTRLRTSAIPIPGMNSAACTSFHWTSGAGMTSIWRCLGH
jgi:type IV secretory pathway VirB4 component